MKRLPGIAAMVCMMLICSLSSRAQFLKNILNTVQQTAQNRANSKASQTTNKVLDKVDSSTQIKSKSGNSSATSTTPRDTASTNRVLGAFAKAAQQNPNDTSAADLTMKALGIMVAGKEISAADSAAIIKSYMSASGGSGEYYQYVMTSITKKGTSKDTSYHYMTNNGNGRVEMKMSFPGVATNEMITIGHADKPEYTISLFPDNKTYSLNIIDTSLINDGERDQYEVVKLGNETVAGYSCTHAKLTSVFGSGMFKSTTTMEIWTSTDVPGYALYKKMLLTSNIKPQMLQALEKAGCGGFLVKMESHNKDYSMTNVLIKAGEKNLPASLFEIPSGYTESKQSTMFHMAAGVKTR
ncbi:MAG: DUF4412 domain-containing protein [Bacteroidetes bacterium]|nr:DUF4412 domain-containing protein [Bacteroidota bacterium]